MSSVPLIIFAYMYQINIPMIYNELERRNMKTMSGIIVKGSISAVVTYIIIGCFGYLCFATYPNSDEILKDKNIL